MSNHPDILDIASELNVDELKQSLARDELLEFTMYTKPNYVPNWHHIMTCEKMDAFIRGDIKNMMIFMPPQHGKSELSTRRLPAKILGGKPDTKIALVCYNATKARKFCREVKRIMNDDPYKEVYPNIHIGGEGMTDTQDEFDINGHEGGLKAVGVDGSLTGDPVDILIMDDLYKNKIEGNSPTTLDKVKGFYDTVAETRLHNNSQKIIVFTRWNEEDLAGYLLDNEPDEWEVLVLEAIKTDTDNENDPREVGDALWPEKHSLEKLLKIKKRDVSTFDSLYQQDPKPKEGLMYNGLFKTYKELQQGLRKSYTDTADEGSDYLCHIAYNEFSDMAYVTDVIYTQKPMEETEPMVAASVLRNNTSISNIESNNGGKGFSRNVKDIFQRSGNKGCKFNWFHQGNNKAARIYSNSASVMNQIVFPEDWAIRWPVFHKHLTKYRKVHKENTHDDAPDALTGIIEKMGVNKTKLIIY